MQIHKFDVGYITDAGNFKKVNEDCATILRYDALSLSAVLMAVADGVGGLNEGETASRKAIDCIEDWWADIAWESATTLDALLDGMVKTVQTANALILQEARRRKIQMGTTFSAILFRENEYRYLHVGDSRIYRIDGAQGGPIVQLTFDHTAKMPAQVGGRTVEKTYLTECLGYKDSFKRDIGFGKMNRGDIFLLCSDGIYKTIEDKEIGKICRKHKSRVDKASYHLISRAKQNGEQDNLTAAVGRICG